MTAQLPGVLHSIAPILDRYGYLAVVGIVGVEGFGIPAPGQTILIVGGVYAASGQLSLSAVIACGILAAVVGDNIGYAIGHFGGRPLVLRYGRYVFLTEGRLQHVEEFFRRHGNIVVPVARFIDGLRQFNGVVAALAGMPWWRFFTYNVIGAVVWVILWVLVGNFAGNRVAAVYDVVERYQNYLLIGLGFALAVWMVWWIVRRRTSDGD
ncbi:DedA family protein [Mycolicibacterium sphagni]|uniref:Alkaline phosphatase n=1 Tax=Mycolicibacterium sphagni TaxID=1786 RepID=A0A255D7R3_9MYCO|nr:DedA family protein [Mycolicibacterium sphagni]MCV7174187.1 DedA family protein [Mycolicibacterium sphagni]OYN75439.1 alkaline phosphatase [Mycolicibacterium sphagni]